MNGPAAAELRRQLETVQLVQERLRRVTVALTVSEEAVADLLDSLAERDTTAGPHLRAHAGHAREVASVCRAFANRIDVLAAAVPIRSSSNPGVGRSA